MPYPSPFTRFSFMHLVNGTDEIAMTDLTVAAPLPVSPNPVPSSAYDAIYDAISDAYVVLWSNGSHIRADYSRYVGLKVQDLDANGKYVSDAYTYAVTPVAGNAGNVPAQCSTVISLRSGSALGKGNYGRMYLPHTMYDTATNSPYPPAGRAQGNADAGAIFITTVNAALTGDYAGNDVRIMGQTGPAGTNKLVTQVAAGRVTDTQRRRRNKLTEDYAFAPVTS